MISLQPHQQQPFTTPPRQDGLHAADDVAPDSAPRTHTRRVVACDAFGQPRTYRLSAAGSQPVAYRRLALTILGLDVATLAVQLRAARRPMLARAA